MGELVASIELELPDALVLSETLGSDTDFARRSALFWQDAI